MKCDNLNNSEMTGELAKRSEDLLMSGADLLEDARNISIVKKASLSLPIAQLSTLGSGVASLIPTLSSAVQSAGGNPETLYRIVNAATGDVLKMAKNGNAWGAMFTESGKSKMVQLQAVNPATINPAMIMMAVALFAIEKELGNIADMEKQIISFLQIEKEAEIEADVITLGEIISKYKHNWDNERYMASNHKLICDIQRTARKNMISYQKQVAEALKAKQFIVVGPQVNSALTDVLKKFKYYRLALYTFSLSSLTEIMLSGNFKEENITAAITEIRSNSEEYRKLYGECSVFLENMSKSSIETNLLTGIGVASDAIGNVIGNIPFVKNAQADKFLIDQGGKMKSDAQNISKDVIASFAEVSNPSTAGFVSRLEDMNNIYNHTREICIVDENIYLIK